MIRARQYQSSLAGQTLIIGTKESGETRGRVPRWNVVVPIRFVIVVM